VSQPKPEYVPIHKLSSPIPEFYFSMPQTEIETLQDFQ